MHWQDKSSVYIYFLDTEKEQSAILSNLIPIMKERFKAFLTDSITNSSAWWIRRKMIGWALLDFVLTNETGVSLPECTIKLNDHGKPMITNVENLHYNLSHSGPYFMIGISRYPVGVDIEVYRKISSQLSKRVFTPAEQHSLPDWKDPLYAQAFLKIWTKKESYSKAIGKGFQILWDTLHTDQSIQPYHWITEINHRFVYSICCYESEKIVTRTPLSMASLGGFYQSALPS